MTFLRPLAVICLGLPGLAAAQTVPDDLFKADVIAGWRTADGTHMAALHLTLADGWHTYWRSPGEAGIPPRFDWSGSRNVGAATIHWPIPQVFMLNGLRTLGYEDELILPVEFTPRVAGSDMAIAADVEIGVCEEICVPVSFRIEATLPDQGGSDPLIAAALTAQPEPGPRAGLTGATCTAEPIRDGLRLTTAISIPETGPGEFGVIELADGRVWVSPAAGTRAGGILTLVADLVPPDSAPFALDRSGVRITLFGGGRAVDIRGCTG